MKRVLSMIFVLALAAGQVPAAHAADAQRVVDGARSTVIKLRNDKVLGSTARDLLHRARAVLIVPRLVKVGFILAGEGGTGVLLVRDPKEGWSYPAFYGLGGGSVGFQIGGEISRVMLIIMSERALEAVMRDQFKIGAEADLTVATLSAGAEAATTSNAGADIYAVAGSKGLFGGVSLKGAVISARPKLDADYYERSVSAEDIVLHHAVLNAFADALRSTLAKP